MQPIHFDIDSARAAKRELEDIHSELQADMKKITNEVEYVKFFWRASAANDFYGQFEDFRSSIQKTLDPLLNLAHRLGIEISQWEEAAKHLG